MSQEDNSSPAVKKYEELMHIWRRERHLPTFDSVGLLNQFCDLFEQERNHFYSLDPDPFDDRHPSRSDPTCSLGQLLRMVAREDLYLEWLTDEIVATEDPAAPLAIATTRLFCSLSTGITLAVTGQEDDATMNLLYRWAACDVEPVNCYATFIIGSLMDNRELLYATRAKNLYLIPILMNRVQAYRSELSKQMEAARLEHDELAEIDECSNRSLHTGMQNLLGSFHLHPLSTEMKLRLSINYLIPLAEYQDMMQPMYEGAVLPLVLILIDRQQCRDIRLSFDTLRLLASLLCHRCVHMEFVERSGLQQLLRVPRPSVAATAVSITIYYIAYFDNAMERVCQLPKEDLARLMEYALWLLECSHPSARCYTLYFLHSALCYGTILHLFEQQDGLRYMYNALCTLPTLLSDEEAVAPIPPPFALSLPQQQQQSQQQRDRDLTPWQIVRSGVAAIKRYLEVSLLLWGETFGAADTAGALFDESPKLLAALGNRAIRYTSEQVARVMEVVILRSSPHATWPAADQLDRMGAIGLFYRIISRNVNNYIVWQGRVECIRGAVELLGLLCVPGRIATRVACTEIPTSDPPHKTNGLELLLGLLNDKDDTSDVTVQKAILSLICCCVCRPIEDKEKDDTEMPSTSSHLKTPTSSRKRKLEDVSTPAAADQLCTGDYAPPVVEEIGNYYPAGATSNNNPLPRCSSVGPSTGSNLALNRQMRLWQIVRRYHGIMTLLGLLEVKAPISEADAIRTLACKALGGLARSEEVRHMLAKLPLFTKGQLQFLMKEPVLPDKMNQHAEFCRQATNLLRLVVGNIDTITGEISLEKIRRAEIVSKTRIHWDQNELLELVCKHLDSRGLHQSAACLQREAQLQITPAAPSQLPIYEQAGALSPMPHLSTQTPGQVQPQETTPTCAPVNSADLPSSAQGTGALGERGNPTASTGTPTSTFRLNKIKPPATPTAATVIATTSAGAATTPSQTTKIAGGSTNCNPAMVNSCTPTALCRTRLQEVKPTPSHAPVLMASSRPPAPRSPTTSSSEVTLGHIVETYLQQQHAQCPHPLSVCPRFSLTKPHRCPAPELPRVANLTRRMVMRETLFNSSLRYRCLRKEDRRFIYSRFMPSSIVRDLEDDMLTCCTFNCVDGSLFVGSSSGVVASLGLEESGGAVVPSELFHSHTQSIQHMQNSNDGSLLIVCSSWGQPRSSVARVGDSQIGQVVLTFKDENYAEFSKLYQDKIIATNGKIGVLYDLGTGTKLSELYSPTKQNNYSRNKATFSPTDQLLLNDGVLWDVRGSGEGPREPVHKFDKFQGVVSGVFHPNCREVLIGSAVWDLRTFRLLHTAQPLDRLEAQFNAGGDVIYAGLYSVDEELEEEEESQAAMASMFRTVDAADYSLIATIDTKRRIEYLAVDSTDISLGLIEMVAANTDPTKEKTHCRIYSIGRKRSAEEDNEDDDEGREEEEDEEDDDEEDDDEDEPMDAEDGMDMLEVLDEIIEAGEDGENDSTTSSSATTDSGGSAVEEGGSDSDASWEETESEDDD